MEAERRVSSANELKEHIRFLTEENVQLRSKLGSFQSKVAQQASSSRDLSSKLVQSEEDKLKISKDLVEAQIETNKLREQYEEEIFQLKNKVLTQDEAISSVEAVSERLKLEAESLRAELGVTRGQSQELEEEYGSLKSSFLSVSEALEQEITHSDQLSEELLTLAHTHDTLLRERQRSHKHTLEVERVRALLSRVSHSRVRPEDLSQNAAADKRAKTQPRIQDELREELEKMRRSYEEQLRRLEEKIVSMGKDQQENKRAIRSTQQELAQQSAALITSQFQLKEVEAENSKLQNHLKDLNQEYRARLTHYIHDITEFARGVCEADVGGRLKEFVDSMLREVRGSYRSREEQLTSSVRNYRSRLNKLNNTHQLLLIAYRMQREQILARAAGDGGLEAGPPEATFSPGESEIRGETERELQRLREDKQSLEKQLTAAQQQVAALSQPSQRLSEEAWTDIRSQLRDMANTAQEAQERERLQLVSRAVLAEQQVCELQEYVDNHLGRYKLEVTRLRRMLGLEAGRSQSAELPKPRPQNTSLRNTSKEI
ncbi:coiled-coil domain-containing protein 78 [Astyanax mexicanus]|uniref:coiled-coil domain-containing protein 78 n=1 Tax=Astyanax mexicanus TaxID=7994 RepID=UPI0020CB6973|nr:coiled-coil domain-containing protein 78 [Astyanax mexicanus]